MTTLEDQLKNKANFMNGDNLFLVRCMHCAENSRGKENYGPMVATGQCAWCGWMRMDKNDTYR